MIEQDLNDLGLGLGHWVHPEGFNDASRHLHAIEAIN